MEPETKEPIAAEPAREDSARIREAVIAAAGRYFDSRRARVDEFTSRHFGVRGSLRLHRAAFGWDLARAPANIALAPVLVTSRLGAAAARKLGATRAADWMERRRILLPTDVARAVERAIVVDLLELPWRDGDRVVDHDALAEAILTEPAVRAHLMQAGRRPSVDCVAEYVGTRSAVAEMTAAVTTLGIGAAAFSQVTPGMISLGPAVATALAHSAAVAAFPLGGAVGSLWYAAFPAAASPALVVGATTGMVAVGALVAAFAGVVADPIQTKLGVHQRRLRRLIDAMEKEFIADEGPGFVAREHYLARVLDLADAGAAALRLARG